ncbi:YceI family protein [Flavobacteriaceae bacterium F89]|uniref:YceI family protein n=1 Tax=Cerina litoralis TaxID=2874477 RepID=A0AAE3JP26_9FLAO|nr:YceI family protein [Cerina litoralis]MCG2460349.1 YceI family protein [Cerina litoralis]
MQKSIIFFALTLSSLLSAQSTWKADTADSNVDFSISHLIFSQVNGSFTKFDIKATADDDFDSPTFTANIATASINTNNSKRDKDLRDEDYFDAATYPTMAFKSTSYKRTGEKTFRLGGNLTIKGTTKHVELEGKLGRITTDPQSRNPRMGLKFTGTINRKDFNVGSSIIPMGDEAAITINLEMVQQ